VTAADAPPGLRGRCVLRGPQLRDCATGSRGHRIRLRSNRLRIGRDQYLESTYEPPFASDGWS